jgi:hypothetical protein
VEEDVLGHDGGVGPREQDHDRRYAHEHEQVSTHAIQCDMRLGDLLVSLSCDVNGSRWTREPLRGDHVSAGGPSNVELDRAKSVGEIIGDAVRCYAFYPALFAILTLAVLIPSAVIVRLVEQANLIGGTHHGAVAALALGLIDVLLVGPLVSALHVHAVLDLGAGRVPRIATSSRGV